MPMARRLAAHYRSPGDQRDIEQVAYVGLVKAAKRYDASRGTTFLTYAIPTITGEIKKHFRDTSWGVHVPRGLQVLALKAQRAIDELAGELGRSPTVDDVAARLGVDREVALEAILATGARDTYSLDAPSKNDEGRPASGYAAELADIDDRFAVVERDLLRRLLATLTARERTVLGLRYFEGLTQTEIAARIGVSQMAVSRLLRRTLERLQTAAQSA